MNEDKNKQSGNNEHYVTREEFCTFLKISRNTLENWLNDGMPRLQPQGKGKLLIPKFKALKWLEYETPGIVKIKNKD